MIFCIDDNVRLSLSVTLDRVKIIFIDLFMIPREILYVYVYLIRLTGNLARYVVT